MADRLEMLKELGDAPARSLPAEEVRRRGDRLRHRRTALQALAAAAAVAAVASGGLLVTGHPTSAPAPIVATTGPEPTPPTSPAPSAHVLSPDGYRDLRLGMDAAEVRATGDATVPKVPTTGCVGVRLTDSPPPANDGGVTSRTDGYLSARYGLVAIYARPDMATPEGVHPGSTFAQVKAAYPDGRLSIDGYWIVPLRPGTAYEFGVEADHRVGEMAVMRVRQDCFN